MRVGSRMWFKVPATRLEYHEHSVAEYGTGPRARSIIRPYYQQVGFSDFTQKILQTPTSVGGIAGGSGANQDFLVLRRFLETEIKLSPLVFSSEKTRAAKPQKLQIHAIKLYLLIVRIIPFGKFR